MKTLEQNLHISRDSHDNVLLLGESATVTVTTQQSHKLDILCLNHSNKLIQRLPFVGLSAYEAQDCLHFYGREQLLGQLLDKFNHLQTSKAQKKRTIRLLTVLGAPYSGKSSLVQAGLLSALACRPHTHENPASDIRAIVMTPRQAPFATLGHLLLKQPNWTHGQYTLTELIKRLQADNGINQVISSLINHERQQVVLIIDDFEQLFTHCTNHEQRQLFIDNLVLAAADKNQHISVVLTLRHQFLAHLQRYRLLYQTVARQSILMTLPRREELSEIASEAARQANYPFNSVTIEHLVQQAYELPNALPYLQMMLMRLWWNCSQGISPAETLAKVPNLIDSIEYTLQQSYQQFSETQQKTLQQLCLQLLHFENSQQTELQDKYYSKTVQLSKLAEKLDKTVILHILEILQSPEQRWIILENSVDEQGNLCRWVRFNSDILIQQWSRLQDWLAQRQADKQLKNRLVQAVRVWEQQQRHHRYLWQSPDLDLLQQWHQRAPEQFSALQLSFFEAAQGQQRHKKRWQRLGFLSLLLLICLFGWQIQQAEQRKFESQHQRDAAFEMAKTALQQRDEAQRLLEKTRRSEQLAYEELGKARDAVQQARLSEQNAQKALDEFLTRHFERKNPKIHSAKNSVLPSSPVLPPANAPKTNETTNLSEETFF